MNTIKRLFLHSPRHYAIAAGIGLAVAAAVLTKTGFVLLFGYIDALTTAGAVLVLLGLLMLTARLGAFDVFAFALTTLHGSRRYPTLYDYTEAKGTERKKREWTFLPYMATGAVFLIVGFLLRLGM